ncbi:MAG: hypothetical protein GY870_04945 [archaeon]|nr:hypothetical protein [archaeon]
MTTLENYIKEKNLENHEDRKNIELLFNAAIPVYRNMIAKDRCVTHHKNESVNYLAGYAANFASAGRFKLNTSVFNHRFVTDTLTKLLRNEPTAQPHPFDTMKWG